VLDQPTPAAIQLGTMSAIMETILTSTTGLVFLVSIDGTYGNFYADLPTFNHSFCISSASSFCDNRVEQPQSNDEASAVQCSDYFEDCFDYSQCSGYADLYSQGYSTRFVLTYIDCPLV